MSLALLNSLRLVRFSSPALAPTASRLFASGVDATKGTPADPLEADERTTKSQQRADATNKATQDSIRHASEGEFTEAVKDVGRMAKNAAKGAMASGELIADSEKRKATGEGLGENVEEDLKKGDKKV